MSFWLNDNRFIVCLRQITAWHKLALSMGLLGGVAFVSIYFFYIPILKNIKAVNSETKNMHAQLLNLQRSAVLIENEKILNKRLKLDFNSISPLMPDFGYIFNFFLEAMGRCNISCSNITPLYTKQKGDFLKHYFYIVLKGKFCEVMSFCREVNKQGFPLKFCYVKIVRWKDERIKMDIVFRFINIPS